jgi:hypothetical protein
MPTIEIKSEQLLDAALQMPDAELEDFLAKLFTARAREYAPVLSQKESDLLIKINQGLPHSTQQRLNLLIRKRRTETISREELKELKQLTAQVEKSDAERLKLLVELAKLRNVPLRKLTKQLGLKPVSHD